nr:hypothetical protein Iba_chr06aCG14970 [Ipomoea batatas]GME10709.1 hypothetical protein Iba_scaffold10455CG0020 [Ipomoea batatas]
MNCRSGDSPTPGGTPHHYMLLLCRSFSRCCYPPPRPLLLAFWVSLTLWGCFVGEKGINVFSFMVYPGTSVPLRTLLAVNVPWGCPSDSQWGHRPQGHLMVQTWG